MLEISVTFEEFQLVFNFMLFFHFNTIFFNSWKIQSSKNLGGCSPSQPPQPGFYRSELEELITSARGLLDLGTD